VDAHQRRQVGRNGDENHEVPPVRIPEGRCETGAKDFGMVEGRGFPDGVAVLGDVHELKHGKEIDVPILQK